MSAEPKTVRCAIYTRKSIAEGLEQEFNSLDAQREAAEAFIASQRHEGWICLPTLYDDGGFSGGNADRPALKALMDDVRGGEVDCIVVYKVDRLSRSLLDFSRIMGTLEENGVAFVSVTQQFNTSHSMGRLTLNILLSFAQFEREIIAERTRDKVHSARRKGKWTGGPPILGYDVAPSGGRLLVNQIEAQQVRRLFKLYLEKESLSETVRAANAEGLTTKAFTTKKGKHRAGKTHTKHSIRALLRNVHYVGKIPLKDEIFEGEHEAIVDPHLWEQVQRLLTAHGKQQLKPTVRNKTGALLRGILFAAPEDIPMYHSFSIRKNRTYRYYVHREILKRGETTSATRSVPAGDIEDFVVQQIKVIGKDRGMVAETIRQARLQQNASLTSLESDAAALELSISRREREIQKLSVDPTGTAIDRLAAATDQNAREQHRLSEIRDEFNRRTGERLDEESLVCALANFDEVWEALCTKERIRMIHLLIEKVSFNAADSNVTIAFSPSGIKALSQQAS